MQKTSLRQQHLPEVEEDYEGHESEDIINQIYEEYENEQESDDGIVDEVELQQ